MPVPRTVPARALQTPMSLTDAEKSKRSAAARALDYVQPGMRLGLGSGSTAKIFVDLLGARVREGLRVVGVPTSSVTAKQAQGLDIPLTSLEETPALDLTIDGADEFDARRRLIKGGGGALLREKIVAAASGRMIVITDASKETKALGRFRLPVEVERFGFGATLPQVERIARAAGLAGAPILRRDATGAPFVTDGGHLILDCASGTIADPDALAVALDAVPGVMGHGLFIGLASAIIVADGDAVRVIGAQS